MKILAFNRPWAFHFLLFAAFPAVFLYAHNISETSFSSVIVPLIISLLGALLIWIILGLLMRDMRKAALAATIFVVLFFAYGYIYDALDKWGLFLPRHAYLISILLFIWGYSVYFIKIAKRDFKSTTIILNVIAITLIAINLISIGWYEINRLMQMKEDVPPNKQVSCTDNATVIGYRPDIYYIILDEYAHPDTMKEWYSYDNSKFIQQLKEMGFYVADGSRTRVPDSSVSISSTLNMQYFDLVFDYDEKDKTFRLRKEGDDPNSNPIKEIKKMYVHSKVADFLKSYGYSFIYFGFGDGKSEVSQQMKQYADRYFDYGEVNDTKAVSDFVMTFWNTTMIRPFYSTSIDVQSLNYYHQGILKILFELQQIPNRPSPKFVFAHIMCPHDYFVFGRNGEIIDARNCNNYQDKKYYRDQYIFISRKINEVCLDIIKKSAIPPVIIVQSDHGLRPHHPGINIGPDEWRKILNAYYLPGGAGSQLYNSISPVNSFRIIFNYYFHTEFPLLPD